MSGCAPLSPSRSEDRSPSETPSRDPCRALPILDAGEYSRLFDNLVGRHRISLAALLDYARERRPAGLELIRHIKAEFLRNSA